MNMYREGISQNIGKISLYEKVANFQLKIDLLLEKLSWNAKIWYACSYSYVSKVELSFFEILIFFDILGDPNPKF